MSRRGCLIGVVVVLGLCIVGCGVLGVVTVRNARTEVTQALREGLATGLAEGIPREPGQPVPPGEYSLTAAEIQQRLEPAVESEGTDQSLTVSITPAGISFDLATQGQVFTISGRPEVVDGQLVMRDLASNNPGLDFIFPPEQVGEAIAGGINDYLAGAGLRLTEVRLGDGEITFVTEAAA